MENERAIGDLLEAFAESDAIMQDDVDGKLNKFVDEGGDLNRGLDILCESYEGYADMIRAVIDWSNFFGDGANSLEDAVQTVLQDHEQTLVPRLNQVMVQADTASPTVAAISTSTRWNKVVSDMAARQPDSILHNLLTRETRLAKAGVNQSDLQSPKKFLDAIFAQLSDMFSDSRPVSNDDILALYKRLPAMCTYDESTTLLSLGLFHTLADRTDDPITRGLYRRLGQEIRKEAVRVITTASVVNEHEARLYVMKLSILSDCATSNILMRKRVFAALLNIITKTAGRRKFESEAKTLFDCYGGLIGDIGIKHGDGEVVESVSEVEIDVQEKVVLIRTLCQVEIFEEVVTSLFSHEHRTYMDGGNLDLSKRRCLCLLLSYAAVFIHEDERFLAEKLNNASSKEQLRVAMQTMFEKLETVVEVCEDLKPGCPRFMIKGKPVLVLLDALKDPLLAKGVLQWTRDGLYGGADLRALLVTVPKHLAFLEAIAQHHQVLRDDVLNVLRDVFMRDYPGLDINRVEELRDMFLKSMTAMVKVQMAREIVQVFLTSWADNEKVDMAHLRRFITGLLEIISPPYAHSFATSLLKLLDNKRVASAIDKDVKAANLVLKFREHVGRTGIV